MRTVTKIFIILCVAAAAVSFFFFGMNISTVNVEGTKVYSDAEIKQSVFSGKFSDNLAVFTVQSKLFGINKLPFVEDIDVDVDGLHTVTLHVYDKTISGCIHYMGQYVFFDRDGVVLQSSSEKREGVPVITGLDFLTFTVGEAFDVSDPSLFDSIMNLSQLITHYDIPVKKIQVREDEMRLYSGDIVVSLAKKEMYDDEMAALSSVFVTAREEGLAGTIDMKTFQSGDKIILDKKT